MNSRAVTRSRIRRLVLGILMLVLLAPAQAGHGDRRKSLDEAVAEARSRYPGRVLSAETERQGGREAYKIRILTPDGKVKRLRVDPDSGRNDGRR